MQTADRYRRVPGLVIYLGRRPRRSASPGVPRSAFRSRSKRQHCSITSPTGPPSINWPIDLAPADDVATVAQTVDLLLTLAMIEREDARSEGDWMHVDAGGGVLSLRDQERRLPRRSFDPRSATGGESPASAAAGADQACRRQPVAARLRTGRARRPRVDVAGDGARGGAFRNSRFPPPRSVPCST